MANNIMQQLRTTTTGKVANSTNNPSAPAGQIILNVTDGKGWSTNGTTFFEIGGNVTTANISGNIVFTGNTLTVNGGIGIAGQFLTSGGSTANLYWSSASGGTPPGGANTDVQFNDSSAFNGTGGFTFNKTTNNVLIANTLTVSNVSMNGNVVVSATVNTTANVLIFANTTDVAMDISYWNGNSTVNTYVNNYTNASVTIIGNSVSNTTQNGWEFIAGAAGNSTVAAQSAFMNTNSLVISGNSITSATANVTANLLANGTVLNISLWSGNSTVNTYSNTFINSSSITIGNSSVNNLINSTSYTGTANNSLYLGGVIAAAYVVNTMNGNLTGNVTFTGTNTVFNSNVTHAANSYFNGANTYIDGTDFRSTSNNTLAGTNTVISSNLTLSGGFLYGGTANATFNNVTVGGNLIISGTLTTINTSELLVNSNFIEIAENNRTTDAIDSGWFSPAGNSTLTWYSLFGRIAAKSSNNSPYFFLGVSNTNPNTASTFDISAANSAMGVLQSYLVANAFVANSTAVNITATASISSAIAANTLTLTTALAAIYGGTGQTGYTTGDVLYASSGTALSKLSVPVSAANGQFLMITNNLPAYGVADGGTF